MQNVELEKKEPYNWSFVDEVKKMRNGIRQQELCVRDLKKSDLELCKDFIIKKCDIGEVKANIQLAVRHLEDARMRLGKAIQHFDGGVSILDKGECARCGEKCDYCTDEQYPNKDKK